MKSMGHQNNLPPPRELGDLTFILKPIELDGSRSPNRASKDRGFFQQLHHSTLSKDRRWFSKMSENGLIFSTTDPAISSVTELLYKGTATISVGNREEFVRLLGTIEIDVEPQEQQMQFVSTSSSAQQFIAVPRVQRNAIAEKPALKSSLKKRSQSTSVTQTEQRSQMTRAMTKARRKTTIGKPASKPMSERKDCPKCDAVFGSEGFAKLHFDRVHMKKRERQHTGELTQTQPVVKRVRFASMSQNRSRSAGQSSAVETARAETSLRGPAAKPHEDTQNIGEVTSSLLPAGVVDYHQENRNALFEVPNYADDIFKHLKQRESAYEIKCYVGNQSKRSRSLVIDGMGKMQEAQGLWLETLFLAVKIIDTYLGKESIAENKLQLLGTAALWIASKYEEHKKGSINELLAFSDNQHTQEEMLKMEKAVLRGINFDLGFPLSLEFLRKYALCSNASTPLLSLASFILEFSLMFYSLIQVKGSAMACAVLFMARRMTDQEGWNATLEHHSGYEVADFAHVVKHLNKLLRETPAEGIARIKMKYSQADHCMAAKIPLKDIKSIFEDYPEILV